MYGDFLSTLDRVVMGSKGRIPAAPTSVFGQPINGYFRLKSGNISCKYKLGFTQSHFLIHKDFKG